jgi:hypothetical protein
MGATAMATYHVKLLFEWGGGALWPANDAARDRFGLGPLEDVLPLTAECRDAIERLGAWHDTALDWNYPPDPSPWTDDESARFEAAVIPLLEQLRRELGPDFEVTYQRL